MEGNERAYIKVIPKCAGDKKKIVIRHFIVKPTKKNEVTYGGGSFRGRGDEATEIGVWDVGRPMFHGQALIGQCTLEISRYDESGRECSMELERVRGGDWITYFDGETMHAGKVGMPARKNARIGTVSILIQRMQIEEALSSSDESMRENKPPCSKRGEDTRTGDGKGRSVEQEMPPGEPEKRGVPEGGQERRGPARGMTVQQEKQLV